VAQTELGELHGALSDINHPPAIGQTFTLCIRPECLHLDIMPPKKILLKAVLLDTLFQGDFSLHAFYHDSRTCIKNIRN
jgi:hypothetical protein